MEATATSGFLKRAWIRDADVPAGQPARGHFNCECGRKVRARFYGQGGNMRCECGTLYSNTGWILERGERGANLSRAGVTATV